MLGYFTGMDNLSNVTYSHWNHTGAILAGGLSKRMGSPKEGVQLWDSRPMIEHVIETLEKVCKEVVIVGKCEGYDDSEKHKIIPDMTPNFGPLGGIKSLLSSNIDNEYIVAACDQPFLTEDLLRLLIKEGLSGKLRLFQTGSNKKINPFPGYFSTSLLQHVKDSIKKGKTAMHEMIESYSNIHWIPIEESKIELLRSINTQHDLKSIALTNTTLM